MGSAKITILAQNGNVITKVQLKELTQVEMGQLISDIELLRLDLLSKYKSQIKRFDKREDE